jgi:glutamyl-tRNA synthetase/nondiscriminating glutamyl-tRNA synthetase
VSGQSPALQTQFIGGTDAVTGKQDGTLPGSRKSEPGIRAYTDKFSDQEPLFVPARENIMPKIRVRFAPSPTGYVHVGNARTALFNWLLARHEGGDFILRIEDTDPERSEARYETQLLEDLRWFGLDWDEGPDKPGPHAPYRQSERKSTYQEFAARLLEEGQAYYCFCTPEQLEAERHAALAQGHSPGYSGRCRAVPPGEAQRRLNSGEAAAIRLKIPERTLAWDDLVHGPLSFASNVVGDFILVRSDGHPAYNYAVVIDDHLMEITDVIRGDDHTSNTPRQLAVYYALGWEPPRFAHLSTILGADRARLSKRHGATSLSSFRDLGILPEALMNYLALLGWSPADGVTELLTRDQLIAQFSLAHVHRAPAVFDQEKLNWMNRHYFKQSSLARLARLGIPFLVGARYLPSGNPLPDGVLAWLERVIDAVLKNLDTLSQLPDAARQIFEYDADATVGGEETGHAAHDPVSRQVLESFIPKVLALDQVTYDRFRDATKSTQKETGKKGKDLFHPIRVALTGALSGPELEKLVPILEEGAKLPLTPPVKSSAARLREFAQAAGLQISPS